MIASAKELRSARMKLQRAKEHLGELILDHARFTDPTTRNPYRKVAESDATPGYTLWRAKIVEAPPLEKWGSLVGECVHALRSALDHTAHMLVQINRPGSDYSEFPICKTRDRWRTDRKKKLPDVPGGALVEVQRLQPYKRGAEARFHPLWLIHNIDISDKHRRLNLVSPLVRNVELVTEDCKVVDHEIFAGPFVDGTPISRQRTEATGPNPRVRAEFAFDITFGEGEPLEGEPVIERLHDLRLRAGRAVSLFEKFFL